MKVAVQVDSIVPLTGQTLYEIFQTLTPKDCERMAGLEVDEQLWFNEVLIAFRVE